jgi:hypothetical protein
VDGSARRKALTRSIKVHREAMLLSDGRESAAVLGVGKSEARPANRSFPTVRQSSAVNSVYRIKLLWGSKGSRI